MENLLRDNKEKLFCWFDFEGCNVCLHECNNLPWQVGAILQRNNKIEDTYSTLIKWPEPLNVSKIAAKITRYDAKKVEEFGKPPEQVLDELLKRFHQSDIIAGYNIIGYDGYVTQAFCRKLGRAPYNIVPKMFDLFPISKAVKLEIPYNSNEDFTAWQYRLFHRIQKGLKTKPEIFGKELGIEIDVNQLHDALYDIQLLTKIWDKLKYMITIKE